jgi:hypothetical protein
MSEEQKNTEERQKVEGEGLKEEIPDPPTPANELVPENITSVTPSTLNHQPSTMEVHHHGHVHSKKKWKEYVFQFFMLFLAVFCGFLAEYQLEHTIEHNREKQFMKSMVEDLEKDVVRLKNELKLVTVQYTSLDSLTVMIYNGKYDPLQVRKMYELQRRYLYPLTLTLINRTELQLKNAGGMRLIRNRQVADSIINYWTIAELIYETRDAINAHRGKAKDISFMIFNNKYYKHSEDISLNFSYLDSLTGEPKLMTTNPLVLTEFANRVSHITDLLRFNYKLRRLHTQHGNALRLIELIKKEYHMNNERERKYTGRKEKGRT